MSIKEVIAKYKVTASGHDQEMISHSHDWVKYVDTEGWDRLWDDSLRHVAPEGYLRHIEDDDLQYHIIIWLDERLYDFLKEKGMEIDGRKWDEDLSQARQKMIEVACRKSDILEGRIRPEEIEKVIKSIPDYIT